MDSPINPPDDLAGALPELETWWNEHNPPIRFEDDFKLIAAAAEPAQEPFRADAAPPKPQELDRQARRLEEERRALEDKLARLEAENAKLTQYRAAIQGEILDMRLKMSQAQEGYEAHIIKLEERGHETDALLRGLQDDKRFLSQQVVLHSERAEAAEAELRLAQESRQRLERELIELKVNVETLRKRLAEREEELARKEGALEELRKQAAVLQSRAARVEQLSGVIQTLKQQPKPKDEGMR